MRPFAISRFALLAGAFGAWAAAGAALPPYTAKLIHKSGDITSGGRIASPFGGLRPGEGFREGAVNNAGAVIQHLGLSVTSLPNVEAVIFNPDGTYTPGSAGSPVPLYLAAGAEQGFSNFGFVTIPSTEYTLDRVFCTSMNNNGDRAIALGLRAGAHSPSQPTPITGVYFNATAMPIQEAGPVTAAGVDPGTVFAPFSSSGMVAINDANQLLVATQILESSVMKNAILRVQLDANGAQVSQTLIAKEGGPVGAGPDTWASLSTALNTCAMNNAGVVMFSGAAAGGTSGIFKSTGSTGSFVAVTGGATPIGSVWSPLPGTSLDMNSAGDFAFRGIVQGNGDWTEAADAGETFSQNITFTANYTAGGGYLRRVLGELSTDHDVDLYYITVGDPTLGSQESFTATTVPDPGAGFAGAAFDTVLYLFATNDNYNGNHRVGLGRSDDAAPGVVQSALTDASLPTNHAPGAKYFLAVSTPKARAYGSGSIGGPPATPDPNFVDIWQADPARLALSGGTVYWVGTGQGQIGRADLASGALMSPLQVGPAPTRYTEGTFVVGDGPFLLPHVAVSDAGASSKVYFAVSAVGADRIRRCNPDGTSVEDVIAAGSAVSAADTSALAFDNGNHKLYWATTASINRVDPDVAFSEEAVLTFSGFTTVSSMALDPFPNAAAGKIYWMNTSASAIERCDLDGSNRTTVLTPVNAESIAIDSVARRLYYTSPTDGKIGVLDLNTDMELPALALTALPVGIAMDAAAGRVYWSAPSERTIRRTSVASPAAQDWAFIGKDVGEYPAHGAAMLNASFREFRKFGAPAPGALPYQIKLTGATFASPAAMICKNNTQRIVLAGDALAGTLNRPLTDIGSVGGPVRLSDRGLAAWRGRWRDASGSAVTGVFMGIDKVIDDTTVPVGSAFPMSAVGAGPGAIELSSNGQYLVAIGTNGSFTAGASGNYCVRVAFDNVPGCFADFNGVGGVTIDDLFLYINAYFQGLPSADTNGVGGVTIDDLFLYINAYFTGCP